jgi:hypothetical protein
LQLIPLDGVSKGFAFAQEVFLADELREGGGSHPISQRCTSLPQFLVLSIE